MTPAINRSQLMRAAQRLRRNSAGVSIIEFSLALPLLVGFALGGFEMANYILASNTTQRVATMTADLVAQSGVGGVSTTEAQLYDLFYALDVAAKPYDLRKNGRVVFSVIKGVRQNDNSVRNEWADSIYAQQFDGNYVAAPIKLGCHSSQALPTFSRTLPPGEILAHAQVTYLYQPLFVPSGLTYFSAPREITRTAVFRMRKNKWNITNDGAHPAKGNCATIDGK